MKTPTLKIKTLHPNAIVPQYAHQGDACFDLYAATVDGFSSPIGANVWFAHPVVAGTGLAFAIPDGWAMLIYSRSGHGFEFDTRLANCVGVIDSGYRGEVMVRLTSDASNQEGIIPLSIKPGDRVAQAMLVPVHQVAFELADELEATVRGAGGFGSTGA